MHDFNCSDPDDMHYSEMADRTRYLKETAKGVSQMSRILDEMKDETRQEMRIDIALKMLASNEPDSKVEKYTGLSKEDIRELKNHKITLA